MRFRFALLSALVFTSALCAQSVWQSSSNKNWETDGNWSVSGFPNSASVIAEFGSTSQPAINVSSALSADGLHFTSAAPAYTFSLKSGADLIVDGSGIVNDSTATQTFAVKATGGSDARIIFANSASAGNATFTALGTLSSGTPTQVARVNFQNTASAGTARITAQDAGSVTFSGTATAASAKLTMRDTGSYVTFQGNSTAADATIASVAGGRSRLEFRDAATAARASINLKSGGTLVFWDDSSAGSATIVSNSTLAPISFIGRSTAGSATIDTPNLSFSGTASAGSSALTLRGTASFAGHSTAGSATLTVSAGQQVAFGESSSLSAASVVLGVGSSILFTDHAGGGSGVISGPGGLEKNGAGSVTLSGASTYTGSTSVNAGTLLIDGSLADTAVTVASSATLGGRGTLGGLATLANGAHLAPGAITFQNGLILQDGAMLDFALGTNGDHIQLSGGTLTGPGGAGGLTLNLTAATGFGPGTYTLFDFVEGNTLDFDVADFSFGSLVAGTSASDFTFDLTSTSLLLTYHPSAIPEPATCTVIAAGAALGLALWRRRDRSRRAGNQASPC